MAWQNAPALNKLAASPLIGKNGAQIWGVDIKGRLYTNYQITPGGGWDGWMTNSWHKGGYPESVYELCAAQYSEGQASLWVIDMKRKLWVISQGKDGNWFDWTGPGWNNLPNNVQFKKLTAAWMGPMFGAHVWGITEDGVLMFCNQHVPPGNWSPWQKWPETPSDTTKNPPVLPARWIEVSACAQVEGRAALWALDTKMQLWAMFQDERGGKWGPWQGPNWKNAPKLRNIAAVDISAPSSPSSRQTILGACILGITDDYQIVYSNQSMPGNDDWWKWTPATYRNTVRGYEITAARQNNRSARVWVITNDQVLVSQQMNLQSSPPGWEWYWTPDLETEAEEKAKAEAEAAST
jgi:hypothetical protein